MDRDLRALMARINVTFTNESLLHQALVHRSYLNEHRSFPLAHNERLEFLGDAVLELVVTTYLYDRFPSEPEGRLTAWRSALVNTYTIARHAKALAYDTELYLSRGEAHTDSKKAKTAILANAYEAVIGAIYLDQGYDVARAFITRDLLEPEVPRVIKRRREIDPKSTLQELIQEAFNITPTYRVLEEDGPDHDKSFRVGLYIGKTHIADGEGRSKQTAQVAAAKAALQDERWRTIYEQHNTMTTRSAPQSS